MHTVFEGMTSPYWLPPQSCEQHWQWSRPHEPQDRCMRSEEKRGLESSNSKTNYNGIAFIVCLSAAELLKPRHRHQSVKSTQQGQNVNFPPLWTIRLPEIKQFKEVKFNVEFKKFNLLLPFNGRHIIYNLISCGRTLAGIPLWVHNSSTADCNTLNRNVPSWGFNGSMFSEKNTNFVCVTSTSSNENIKALQFHMYHTGHFKGRRQTWQHNN